MAKESPIPLPPPLREGKGPEMKTPGALLKEIESPIELMGGEDKLAEQVREAIDRTDKSFEQIIEDMGLS